MYKKKKIILVLSLEVTLKFYPTLHCVAAYYASSRGWELRSRVLISAVGELVQINYTDSNAFGEDFEVKNLGILELTYYPQN